MDQMKQATANLMAVYAEATTTAGQAANALRELGVDVPTNGTAPAPTRKPRAKKKVDKRPLPERFLDQMRKSSEPTAAGALARDLHISPKQAADTARELADAGALRKVAENRRGSALYEVAQV